MKIKSADKNSVNYPLKKELAPALLSVALSVAGYTADLSEDNGTKEYSAKAMEQQPSELHKNKKFDINDTSLSLSQEKYQIDGSTEKTIQRILKLDTPWKKIEKPTAWETVEKPTALLGYSFPADYEEFYQLEMHEKFYRSGRYEKFYQLGIHEDIPFKF